VTRRTSRSIEALLALETIGIKLGLEQIRALVEVMSRPDRAFPSIVVAGTNGKGSVAAMIERGLRSGGCRTGLFTSPHLIDLEERFAIDGRPITRDALEAAAGRVLSAAEHLAAPPSFFEATTALALDVFRSAQVDVAVLEVGLGGRLDATNVVDAAAVAITSIDFDHEEYLGSTLEAIAREKAGVIRPGALVVLADNPPAVEDVVAAATRAAGARLVRAREGVSARLRMMSGRASGTIQTPVATYADLTFNLAGRHQIDNGIAAVRLLEELESTGVAAVPTGAIRAAVEEVTWPARLETIRVTELDVLVDGAHNPAGARALASFLGETYGRRLPIVMGAMRDKNLDGMVAALAGAARCFVMTSVGTGRAARPEDLAAAAVRVAPDIHTVMRARPIDALKTAAGFGAPVVVAGSLYLAGEIRAARA
jgi:dihydrofolate synthase/folylpolyglutamate synthase